MRASERIDVASDIMRDQSSLEAAAIVAIGRQLGLAGFVDLVKYNGFLGSSGAVVKLGPASSAEVGTMRILCASPKNKIADSMEKNYTLWLFNRAMENEPFIDGLPIYIKW
jgi:hypothetical protein